MVRNRILLVVLAVIGLCRADPDLQCDNATRHEVPDCRFPCPPQRTCQNRNGPEPPCVPPSAPCTPTCVCADGYARNQYGGYCVTYAQCDQCPGNNQYFACDGAYVDNCPGSCHCADGYARDSNNVCVSTTPPPVDTHPPPPPPPPTGPVEPPTEPLTCNNVTLHEVPACTYGCPPETTCQNRNWPPLPCAPPAFPCTERCVCANGYARNRDGGTCVTLEQCDRCPGENEYFECDGDYCENCVGHCYCYSGYTRDINDECVYVDPASGPIGPPQPATEATVPQEPITCDNETLHEVPGCLTFCPPEKTCQNKDSPPRPCPPPPTSCTQKCVCADGFARNQDGGTCVTIQQCDKCPGEGQYFDCNGPYSENCTYSCHCSEGYARDSNNICVSTATESPIVYCPPPYPPPSGPQPQAYPRITVRPSRTVRPVGPVRPVTSVRPVRPVEPLRPEPC